MKRVQLATIQKDFQRVINFDRIHPANKIIIFIEKSATEPNSPQYKKTSQILKKLKEYCQLTKIEFSLKVVDTSTTGSLLTIVFNIAKLIASDYKADTEYLLNLGDESIVMNISLFQAMQIIKSLFKCDAQLFINSQGKEESTFYTGVLISSFEHLVSEPVSIDLLNSILKQYTVKEIASKLKISIGSVSNHIKYLKDLGLVHVHGHTRTLTDLGILIQQILQIKSEVI